MTSQRGQTLASGLVLKYKVLAQEQKITEFKARGQVLRLKLTARF